MHLCTTATGGQAKIPMAAPDMKLRAVEFLTRPFGDLVLLKQDHVARRQAEDLSRWESSARR
jgi:FixJ family two-component response regulator